MSVLTQLVTRNWRLKVSAFVLSVFLWTIVTVQPRNREIIPAVPVQVMLSDPAWALAEAPSPTTVTVHLGGVGRDLLEFLPREVQVWVPIDRVTSPDTVVRLRPDWVVLGGGSNIVVQTISPASVALRFEPTLTTAVPLSLRTVNDFPAGVALVQPLSLSPQVTTVRGPARVVQALDSISLEPLDLSRINASRTYPVNVDTAGLRGLTFQPRSAQVAVNLQPASERVLAGVPVVIETLVGVDSMTLVPEPATVTVTLRGALSLLAQVDAQGVAAVVPGRELQGIAAGTEWRAPIQIRGVPPLVSATAQVDSVRVVRVPVSPPPPVSPDTLAVPGVSAPPDTTQLRGGSRTGRGAPPAREGERRGRS